MLTIEILYRFWINYESTSSIHSLAVSLSKRRLDPSHDDLCAGLSPQSPHPLLRQQWGGWRGRGERAGGAGQVAFTRFFQSFPNNHRSCYSFQVFYWRERSSMSSNFRLERDAFRFVSMRSWWGILSKVTIPDLLLSVTLLFTMVFGAHWGLCFVWEVYLCLSHEMNFIQVQHFIMINLIQHAFAPTSSSVCCWNYMSLTC
jgi:hypothetical protein